MLTNLLGKFFKTVFLTILILEICSFWSQQFWWLNSLFFGLILGITLLVSLINLEYGLYILLTELFIGSKGYLFYLDLGGWQISIRIGIFLVVLAVWLYHSLFGRRANQFFSFRNQFLFYYLALGLFIVIGLFNGLAHHSFNQVFFDFNGWLYFAVAPLFFSAITSAKVIRHILSILLAAASYLAIKTLFLLVIFAHQLTLPLAVIYRWIRNSGVGEITFVSGNFYRIFFQSHLFLLIALLIVLAIILFIPKINFKKAERNWLYFLSFLFSTAVISSLSRSFWLGLIVAFICLFTVYIFQYKIRIIGLFKIFSVILIVLVLEVGFLNLLTFNFTALPLALPLEKRFTNLTQEAAGASRIAQLEPLFSAIKKQPILGAGFGQSVTYQSLDPRVKSFSPEGNYTTYAFEWGYLDLWLKIGLFGLLSYFLLLGKVIYEAKEFLKASLEIKVLATSVVCGLIAVIVTSIFSPYLNHPLGISYLILTTAILSYLRNYDTLSPKEISC